MISERKDDGTTKYKAGEYDRAKKINWEPKQNSWYTKQILNSSTHYRYN